MIEKSYKFYKTILSFAWILLLCLGSIGAHAQEAYQNLYQPDIVLKHKVRSMTVELYTVAEGQDSVDINMSAPDFRERYLFDAWGRPSLYEATDINIKKMGVPGPHQISNFEYSDDGRTCHRHDTTVFRSADEWHFYSDSTGRATTTDMVKSGNDFRSVLRTYRYDAKGRLEKTSSSRFKAAEDPDYECSSVFNVHDSYSFSATYLSTQEMARCQCTLEYYDGSNPVRRIDYDSNGNISKGVLYSYDRTGKPIKLERLGSDGKSVTAHADIVYERNGVVKISVTGEGNLADPELSKLGVLARAFVVDQWADWRLLNEVRVLQGGQEFSRYIFSYELR